jgi:acyl carrier protein
MATNGTRAIVFELISKVTSRPAGEIASSGNLLRDYGLSSLEGVELFAAVEARFGVVFGLDPHDMSALATVDTLADWIEARTKA